MECLLSPKLKEKLHCLQMLAAIPIILQTK